MSDLSWGAHGQSTDCASELSLYHDDDLPNLRRIGCVAVSASKETTVGGSLCGPKYLRGIVEPCNGSCCGMRNGKVDSALTDRLNRLAEAWRRITSGEVQL